MKTVLLTGASGMLGRYALDQISKVAKRVICLSRTRPVNLPANAVWYAFDLINRYSLDDIDVFSEDDADEFWHVGALLPGANITDDVMFDANVRSVQWLAQYALKKRLAFRFVSGSTVYANPYAMDIREDDDLSPNGFGGFYGSSKFFAEKILEYYAQQGLRVTILRPSSIYGSGISANKLIARYLTQAMNDQEIIITPPLDQSFNLIFAEDVAVALALASERDITGTFNIAGFNYAIRDIAETCIKVAAAGKLVVDNVETDAQPKPVTSLFDLDDSKIRRALGYDHRTTLHDGLMSMARETA